MWKLKYKFVGKNVEITEFDEFNLEETFDCGQCFRWQKINENTFQGVAFNRYLQICEKENKIILINTSEEDFENIWRKYFDLDLNYSDVKSNLSGINNTMKIACDYAPGIRILSQDPWEALCSFIISQNNNIPRIRGIITRLCEGFGEEICDGIYSFPNADVLSSLSEDNLKPLRSGFRAGYILDAAKKVVKKEVDLEAIKNMDIDLARLELQKIKGVGPKVSECTLLYGFHRLEAFPMDVWMKRAMRELFTGMCPEDFGHYAGIAQQYIFHYSRMNPELVKDKIS